MFSAAPVESAKESAEAGAKNSTGVPPAEEEGFVLEPVEVTATTGVEEKRSKRKRRLVVDTDKEFSGQQIKSQFEDYKDLLQPKCFPPPTKKAMMWKEMAGCDQLFNSATAPILAPQLMAILARNRSFEIPGEPAPETVIELDKIDATTSRDSDISKEEIELVRRVEPRPESEKDVTADTINDNMPADTTSGNMAIPENSVKANEAEPNESGLRGLGGEHSDFLDQMAGIDAQSVADQPVEAGIDQSLPSFESGIDQFLPADESTASNTITQQSTEEQRSDETSQEFEKRRWTKRTQEVLRVLQRGLESRDEVQFSSLVHKSCSRKHAASRFYTCLLLAKEGIITVKQSEPYGEITLKRGPKFTEAAL